MIDLHIHTTASDGELSPSEIINKAVENKIPALAITDHDTVEGLNEAITYSKKRNFEFVPGIEFGCKEGDLIHIVGLWINPKNKAILNVCKILKKNRVKQKQEIIRKLNKLEYKITFQEILKEANGASIGRPHIAQILIRKYPKEFKDISETIGKLLVFGKEAFVLQKSFSMSKIIKSIKNAGGISILAHPGLYKNDEEIIKKFIDAGGEGIEVNYPYKKPKRNNLIKKYKKIADEKRLIISGGSDFHRGEIHGKMGDYGLTEKQFRKLKEKLNPNF